MEEIIRTGGIAVMSALGLAVLVVIVRSQWTIWRKERQQEKNRSTNNNE